MHRAALTHGDRVQVGCGQSCRHLSENLVKALCLGALDRSCLLSFCHVCFDKGDFELFQERTKYLETCYRDKYI